MAKNINYTCDGCYKILYGHDKHNFVKKPHLQINGQIVEQQVDEEHNYQSHTFITPTSQERLCFCLETWQDCLKRYIETRKTMWQQRRENILREQAGEEQSERIETGGYTVKKTRKTRSK